MLKTQHAHAADADDGEEVSEPTMFHRRYAGHLNLSTATMHDTLPLTPQLAFLGHHSGEQRAARVARYQRFAPPACCVPRPHAQRGWQHASRGGSDDGAAGHGRIALSVALAAAPSAGCICWFPARLTRGTSSSSLPRPRCRATCVALRLRQPVRLGLCQRQVGGSTAAACSRYQLCWQRRRRAGPCPCGHVRCAAPAAASAGLWRGRLCGQTVVARGSRGVQPGASGSSGGCKPAGSGRGRQP